MSNSFMVLIFPHPQPFYQKEKGAIIMQIQSFIFSVAYYISNNL